MSKKLYTGSRKDNNYKCLKCGFSGTKMIVQNHIKKCYTQKELIEYWKSKE